MPDRRRGALPGASPQHSTNCSPETVAASARRLTAAEQRELDALVAEQAAEIEFGGRARNEDDPPYPHPGDFRYPNPPRQEVPSYSAHDANLEEDEREGRPWQLDLDVICDRLDAGWRHCVARGCKEFSKRRYCSAHEQKLNWLIAKLEAREVAEGDDFDHEPVPDAFTVDYYQDPETGHCKRGPRKKGLRGDALRKALNALPFTLDELRAAIRARGLRTPEQTHIMDGFRAWIADSEPNTDELAEILKCGTRTIDTYRKEGDTLLEQLEQRLSEKIEQENDRQLMRFLTALGIDSVIEAERITAEAAEEEMV